MIVDEFGDVDCPEVPNQDEAVCSEREEACQISGQSACEENLLCAGGTGTATKHCVCELGLNMLKRAFCEDREVVATPERCATLCGEG